MTSKKTTIIRIFSLLLLLITSLSIFCSCDFELPEQPEAYYEDIYVVVTDIEKKQYYAGTSIREVTLEVYSQEYNLTKRVTAIDKGFFVTLSYMEYEKGDTVKARLCTVFMKSTGQIIDRYIDIIY